MPVELSAWDALGERRTGVLPDDGQGAPAGIARRDLAAADRVAQAQGRWPGNPRPGPGSGGLERGGREPLRERGPGWLGRVLALHGAWPPGELQPRREAPALAGARGDPDGEWRA